MRRRGFQVVAILLLLSIIGIFSTPTLSKASPTTPEQESQVVKSETGFSSENDLYSAPYPRLVLVVDETQSTRGLQIPFRNGIQTSTSTSSFNITYVPAGATDLWGEPCLSFPEEAKTAFNYAASIWTSIINTTVPITIRACWSDLGSSTTLGYSGGGVMYGNFPSAPLNNTYYLSSLANALYGLDLDGTKDDMHITYNSGFSWYFGTDGNPATNTYDLVTVAAHEIAHGLNFTGTGNYSGGFGYYGFYGYPNVYDTFMRDGVGTPLTSYITPSENLGSLLKSNNLWFHGPNAMAANGGSRVKMYAPSVWSSGSSYAHLDYSTFAGTINGMMVYAISKESALHDPGPVAVGLLRDLGWSVTMEPPIPTSVTASDGAYPDKVQITWNPSESADYYIVFRNTVDSFAGANTLVDGYTSTSYDDLTPVQKTLYYYMVKACNTHGCSDSSLSDIGYAGIPFTNFLPAVINASP